MTKAANNKRLRIALLSHGGLAPYDDGIHIHHLVETIRGLSQLADLEVFMLQNEGLPKASFRVGSANVTVVPLEARISLWKSGIRLVAAVLSSHWKQQFDIIHGLWGQPGGISSYIASRLLMRPNVVSYLGGETASVPSIRYGGMLRTKSRLLIEYLATHADLLHLLSNYQLFQLQEAHIRPRSVFIQPFGLASVRPPKPVEHLKRRKKIIIHVANITEVKDQETLLKSFEIIRKKVYSELVIVGGDYLHSTLAHMVVRMKLGSSVRFTGHLPHEEVLSRISNADLMLHCSKHEAQGLVLLEAAALGTPIVTTRVGLGWDWDGRSVLSADPGDVNNISDKVLAVLSLPDLQKQLIRKGLRSSQQLSLEEFCRRLIDQYHALIRRER